MRDLGSILFTIIAFVVFIYFLPTLLYIGLFLLIAIIGVIMYFRYRLKKQQKQFEKDFANGEYYQEYTSTSSSQHTTNDDGVFDVEYKETEIDE